MFDLGLQEIIVIFIVALLVIGPKNLPEVGRKAGKVMRELKLALHHMKTQITEEVNLPENPFHKEFADIQRDIDKAMSNEPKKDPMSLLPEQVVKQEAARAAEGQKAKAEALKEEAQKEAGGKKEAENKKEANG